MLSLKNPARESLYLGMILGTPDTWCKIHLFKIHSLVGFDACTSCVVTSTSKLWNTSICVSFLILVQSILSLYPQTLAATDLFSVPIVLPFPECKINRSNGM